MHYQNLLLLSCFFIGYLLHTAFGFASTTVTCSEPGKLMQTHDIDCAITGAIISGITWTSEKGTNVAGCTLANACFPNAGYTVPVATATSNTLRITSLQVKDVGSWQCRDGVSGIVTRNCDLTVLSSGNCSIKVSGSTLTVDLQQYFCSTSTSFQVENDQGTSCDLSLDDNTVSAEVRDNNGTCQITEGWRGTVVHPVLICGSFRENISCSFEIDPTPATTVSPTSTTEPPDTTSITGATSTPKSTSTSTPKQDIILLAVLIPVAVVFIFLIICLCYKKRQKLNGKTDDPMPQKSDNECYDDKL